MLDSIGAGEKSRTPDLRITNALLYQLSYTGFQPWILTRFCSVLPLKSTTLAVLADAPGDAGNMALRVVLFFGYPAVLVDVAYRGRSQPSAL